MEKETMMQQKRSYSEDFKRDAIRLLETSGKRLSEIEQELARASAGCPHPRFCADGEHQRPAGRGQRSL
jgi:transposase-like protein